MHDVHFPLYVYTYRRGIGKIFCRNPDMLQG